VQNDGKKGVSRAHLSSDESAKGRIFQVCMKAWMYHVTNSSHSEVARQDSCQLHHNRHLIQLSLRCCATPMTRVANPNLGHDVTTLRKRGFDEATKRTNAQVACVTHGSQRRHST